MERQKTEKDIEDLLRWAYIEELSKRQLSAAEGIWESIQDYANHGGIDSGRGAAQRYAHFGLPDPDAERIEKAVSELADTVIDWQQHFHAIAGDLAGLVSINDLSPADRGRKREPEYGWDEAGQRALKAFFGDKGAVPYVVPPRDVLMVGGIKTGALIVMHAIRGDRPDWREEHPEPQMTPAYKGPHAMIVGECRGKNLYSLGSYCPLTWSPSPLSIITARADYFAWHGALVQLAASLDLEKFKALPPAAPRLPWIENDEWQSRVLPVVNGYPLAKWGTLPLKPARPRAGPPRKQQSEPARRVDPSAV